MNRAANPMVKRMLKTMAPALIRWPYARPLNVDAVIVR
jgi:hypothetical protein